MSSKKSIEKSLINETNLKFYIWLKKISKFDISRSLQISSFLINFHLAQNYFPGIDELVSEIPQLMPESLNKQKIREFRMNLERAYNIFVLISLFYNSKITLTKGQTDQQMDELDGFGPLLRRFFNLNSLPKYIKIEEIDKISDYIKDSLIIENYLPQLDFDPLFQEILSSNAIKFLFYTSAPKSLLMFDGKPKDNWYVPELFIFHEFLEARRDPKKKLFKINPELGISRFLLTYTNYMGIFHFGSFKLINEIIELFTKYYSIRIPSKKEEITKFLLCFGELFKLSEGKLYQELSWRNSVERLETKVSQDDAKFFVDKFILEKNYKEFPDNYEDFDAQEFLQLYHKFLIYTGYSHFGIVKTGAYLIWRSLIKYLESLQGLEEFYKAKGELLEKWAFEKAIEIGFMPEKIILINPQREPTPRYEAMIKQIESFPRPPLKLEVKFPEEDHSYYHEIDFAFRIQNKLFLFECKGTKAPIGEEGKYIKWVVHFLDNFELLKRKTRILHHNIKNGNIKHPFLDDIEEEVLNIIKTEGIYSYWCELTTHEYVYYLRNLRESIDNNTFNEFLNEKTQYID